VQDVWNGKLTRVNKIQLPGQAEDQKKTACRQDHCPIVFAEYGLHINLTGAGGKKVSPCTCIYSLAF
jgi:hypothetical protein